MTSYNYLIIGGGMTADAAARAIREADPAGTIGVISSDPHPPYNRPPLSKGLWKGDDPAKTVWRGTDTIGVDLRLGRRVTAVNTKQKTVTDDRGNVISYEKLLLATGGTPRRLPLQTGQVIVKTTHGKEIPVDVIVAGLGIVPNVELAEQAGLRVENGIVVDDLLRTSAPDVYAAAG